MKDSLLKYEPSPRIVFVGGSNISFGLNSQEIKDSLHFNPVNTAIHASLGLKYIFDNINTNNIRKGDVVVVIPEYEHFYSDVNYGSKELLHMILDVNKSDIRLLSLKQIINCMPYTGNIVISRINPKEYFFIEESDVYSVNSFNRYGDVDAHWELDKRDFAPQKPLNLPDFNYKIIELFKEFERKISRQGALLLISFPSFQDVSFQHSEEAINKIDEELRKNEFYVMGTPQRYKIADSLMFNTPYHLNKQGVDRRTALLIDDLKIALSLTVARRHVDVPPP